MVKIYKLNGKFVVSLPPEVVKELGLSESETIDFFKVNSTAFLVSKGQSASPSQSTAKKPEEQESRAPAPKPSERLDKVELSQPEIQVLKKLDTIRYPMRSKESVEKLLSGDDKTVLERLIKRNIVTIFQNPTSKQQLYSISKIIYDKFLMRKKPGEAPALPEPVAVKATEANSAKPAKPIPFRAKPGEIKRKAGFDNPNVNVLEDHGFIVLQTETEASSLSLALEDSIRQGFVIGTRAFNKRFYIILRSFLDRYGAQIMKTIREGTNRVDAISEEIDVDPEGIRAILYLLAESGDVSEKRKDFFVLA